MYMQRRRFKKFEFQIYLFGKLFSLGCKKSSSFNKKVRMGRRFKAGIPPEYAYEKVECQMQGIRDYIKYIREDQEEPHIYQLLI